SRSQLFHFLDHNGLQRRIALERADLSGRDRADFVDDGHSFDDAPENCISPAAWLRVEHRIVDEVDVKLRSAAVWVTCACEPYCAADVRKSVPRLIRNRGSCRLLIVFLVVATALNDEVADHTMKNRAVVVAGTPVLVEVGEGQGRSSRLELYQARTHVRMYAHEHWFLRSGRRASKERKQYGQDDTCRHGTNELCNPRHDLSNAGVQGPK